LINFVFPNLAVRHMEPGYLVSRGILAPRNNDVDEINDAVLATFPGTSTTYLSADSVDQDDNLYAVEFLNSLKVGGLPSHELSLKIGTPIMLLRNLNSAEGLCNGTRLICRALMPHVIEAEIITGTNAGNRVFIPRVTLTPSDNDLPFTLKRRQFPIRLAFAMTINKAQGQTMSRVGIYLRNEVFSHGQLYVACSRVTSRTCLKILIPRKEGGPPCTSNIVYQQVLAQAVDRRFPVD
jgi:PIF1-like helicase/Helicase